MISMAMTYLLRSLNIQVEPEDLTEVGPTWKIQILDWTLSRLKVRNWLVVSLVGCSTNLATMVITWITVVSLTKLVEHPS